MLRKVIFYLCCAVLLSLIRAEARSPSEHGHLKNADPTQMRSSSNIVNLKLPDVELVNQDGEENRFMTDIIGDKLAAVTFTFTTCTTLCQALDGVFSRLQSKIGSHLGKDTVLITLSVDPVNDIPPRLKAYAQKWKARPGWTFLTGEKETVNQLLKAMEVYTPNINDHPPTVFVVDGKKEKWTRLYGLSTPEMILEVLDNYRVDRIKG